jgi:hypothetical protein
VNAAGAQLRTIQETSKRLKLHILISAVLFWGGLLWMFLAIQGARADEQGFSTLTPMITTLMMLTGFVWYIVTKVRIWWHHK